MASIKPNRSGDQNSGFRRFVGGTLDARNVTLKMLISFAYDLPEDRILQGPSWLDSDKCDILAKPDPDAGQPLDTSERTIRIRTQALLADRFKLALHKDTRQLTIFKLLVDKDGPKHLEAAKGSAPDWVNNGRHVSCHAMTMELMPPDVTKLVDDDRLELLAGEMRIDAVRRQKHWPENAKHTRL